MKLNERMKLNSNRQEIKNKMCLRVQDDIHKSRGTGDSMIDGGVTLAVRREVYM